MLESLMRDSSIVQCIDVRGYVYAFDCNGVVDMRQQWINGHIRTRIVWIIVSLCLSAVHDHSLLIIHVLAQDTT